MTKFATAIIVVFASSWFASALPSVCTAFNQTEFSITGLDVDYNPSEGFEGFFVDMKQNAMLKLQSPPVSWPVSLSGSPVPDALKCVLGCLVPGVFAGIVLENFGATALGCMICKNQELDDDSCVAILQTALAVPITLMPATAIAVFKQCTPGCPWGSGDESAVV